MSFNAASPRTKPSFLKWRNHCVQMVARDPHCKARNREPLVSIARNRGILDPSSRSRPTSSWLDYCRPLLLATNQTRTSSSTSLLLQLFLVWLVHFFCLKLLFMNFIFPDVRGTRNKYQHGEAHAGKLRETDKWRCLTRSEHGTTTTH